MMTITINGYEQDRNYERCGRSQHDAVMADLGQHIRHLTREEARDAEIDARANAIFTRMKHAPTAENVLDAIGYITESDAAQMAVSFARQDRLMLGVALANVIENAFSEIAQVEAVRQVERIEREAHQSRGAA